MPVLCLKPGRERSLLRRHPWIFSGAVDHVEGDPEAGETVALLSSKGDFLAQAAYSPHSNIRARVWTFDTVEQVNGDFFHQRIRKALESRSTLDIADDYEQNALRLVYAESDGLPGLIVDRYADVLVIQFLTAGAEYWKDTITAVLQEETGIDVLFERSDADVRGLEGLPQRVGLLHGGLAAPRITIQEHKVKYHVDIECGHKTGFYLDQRRNRSRLRELVEGRDVLDCFCYSGSFTLNAIIGGAQSVFAVDSSAEALALVKQNCAMNDLSQDHLTLREGDAFKVLRELRDAGRAFDLIVLDPPKFAPTTSHIEKASRGYKDVNLLAFKMLRPGGILITFSCSGGVDRDLFQKIVASAALDAQVDAQIIDQLSQSADHPVSLHFPESSYLKGLICRI